MKKNILLVDDDQDLLSVLELKLKKEDYIIQIAKNGKAAIQSIQQKRPDLVVMDVNMPNMNGLDACKKLRSEDRTKNIPIILLTARDEEIDRILGLEFGADDYVTKPFNTRELILRIKNILKRTGEPQSNGKESYEVGCLKVDLSNHEVIVKDKQIQLTLTEFKLLTHLIESPGKIKSRDLLLEQIWEYSDGVFSRTIDTHIQRLRSKLKDAGPYIETVRGVGYRFQNSI